MQATVSVKLSKDAGCRRTFQSVFHAVGVLPLVQDPKAAPAVMLSQMSILHAVVYSLSFAMPLLTVIPQRTAPIPLSAAELGTHSLALLPALKSNVHGTRGAGRMLCRLSLLSVIFLAHHDRSLSGASCMSCLSFAEDCHM